jgi:acetoin utilization protein AcuB
MFIRDVMTTNVVTIPSTTSLFDAKRIMDAHRVRRLPIVDKGKLVGIVTKEALDKTGPSTLTTFSFHELTYLLSTYTVKEAMSRDLVTVSPDATVEEAVALAQAKKVGSLLVMENNNLVGIVTTNDFFYNVLNPILGIGKPGTRVSVHMGKGMVGVQEVLNIVEGLGIEVITLFTMTHPDTAEQDLTVHLNTSDTSKVVKELKKHGYEVHERAR